MNKSKYLSLLDAARNVDEMDSSSRLAAMDQLHEAMMLLDAEDAQPVTFAGAPQVVDMQDFASKLLGMG